LDLETSKHLVQHKSPGKNLWVSFNGVAGRVLLALFQQSYKDFKGKFFRVCCTDHDCTLLDGFPLYWVKKLEFKKPRTLEELTPHDRELCQVLASLGAVFNTVQLIKHEYDVEALKSYIGTGFTLSCLVMLVTILLCLYILPLHTRMFTLVFWIAF